MYSLWVSHPFCRTYNYIMYNSTKKKNLRYLISFNLSLHICTGTGFATICWDECEKSCHLFIRHIGSLSLTMSHASVFPPPPSYSTPTTIVLFVLLRFFLMFNNDGETASLNFPIVKERISRLIIWKPIRKPPCIYLCDFILAFNCINPSPIRKVSASILHKIEIIPTNPNANPLLNI